MKVTIGVDELFQAKGRWCCHLLCDDFSLEVRPESHFERRKQVPPHNLRWMAGRSSTTCGSSLWPDPIVNGVSGRAPRRS